MKDFLLIHDEDARGNRIHSFRMPNTNAVSKYSVRELIKARIENEVNRFNIQCPVCFFTLVQPEDAELTIKGYRLKKHRAISWQSQFEAALQGFEKKSFIVHANGKDFQALDEQIEITDDTDITFIKFMEVVGG